MISNQQPISVINEDAVNGLDDDVSETITIIVTTSGSTESEYRFDVSKEIAIQSGLISGLLESDPDMSSVVISNIPKEEVVLIFDYLTHHITNPYSDIPTQLPRKADLSKILCEYDYSILRDPNDYDFSLNMMAYANYLQIQPLILLFAANMAIFMRSKTIDEHQKFFGLGPYASKNDEGQATDPTE